MSAADKVLVLLLIKLVKTLCSEVVKIIINSKFQLYYSLAVSEIKMEELAEEIHLFLPIMQIISITMGKPSMKNCNHITEIFFSNNW